MLNVHIVESDGDYNIDVTLAETTLFRFGYDASNYASLAAAVTAIGSTPASLYVKDSQAVTANLTIPATLSLVVLRPGLITISSGRTLTVNGPFEAGLYQVFAGAGLVVFGNNALSEVFPEWWGIDGTADEVEIQKALNSIEPDASLVAYPQGSDDYDYEGRTVKLQATLYTLAGYIEVPGHTTLIGSGRHNTKISSSYDGQLIRNKINASIYDNTSIRLSDFQLVGDRTKTSQVGIDLLRVNNSALTNITIRLCGSHGLLIRQSILTRFTDIEVLSCVGDGIKLQQGVVSWTDSTPVAYPSNANLFLNTHSGWNDGAGVRIDDSYGNSFIGGAFESNYWTGGDNVGYNIVIEGASKQNIFKGPWCEGAVQCHVYHNLDVASSDTNIVDGLIHFGNGAAGNVDRAVICNKGNLILINPISHGDAYKTLSGSSSMFRVIKANTGKIFLKGGYSYGKGGGDLLPIDDENGKTANMPLYVNEDFIAANATRYIYGNISHYADCGELAHDFFKTDAPSSTDWDAEAWLRFVGADQSIRMGTGASAPLQILTTRRTGWTAPSGDALKTTFATSTVTLEELAKRVKALIDDLIAHGLIGT